ncbi:helix-turn-helix domain-containing protein [Lacticaseibacillus jixiensis]|uniref:helix-turn-helix domain-containing protein n=1 Tax=Lacticaseibacillus jixiensis TaxID=3231926 RepID=UPI0036F39D5A
MALLKRIKEISKQYGLSLRAVNEKAELGTNAIYRWDEVTPNMESVNKVADVLRVSVDYLLGNTDDPNPAPKLGKPKPVDLADRDVPMMFEGKPVNESDREIIEVILRRHNIHE